MRARRLFDRPIITPDVHPGIGPNINGPSLVRAPDWLPSPRGTYYLYFASHSGDSIRLAFADALDGPWRVHDASALQLGDSTFPTSPLVAEEVTNALWARLIRKHGTRVLGALGPHIASPDVHVDSRRRRVRMYFHGLLENGDQVTRLAVSSDGMRFEARPETLGPSYLRVFDWQGARYAMGPAGRLFRAPSADARFEPGPTLIDSTARHTAVRLTERRLQVFWSRVGDDPERILCSEVDLNGDWKRWRADEPTEILRPERDWEGADRHRRPSRAGVAIGRVNELRDPAVFEEGGHAYLLYSVAGESGIAIAELTDG